jgi:hypothetical protein
MQPPLFHRVIHPVGGLAGKINHLYIEDLPERREFVVVVAIFTVLSHSLEGVN